MRARGCLRAVLTPSASRGVPAKISESNAHLHRWAFPCRCLAVQRGDAALHRSARPRVFLTRQRNDRVPAPSLTVDRCQGLSKKWAGRSSPLRNRRENFMLLEIQEVLTVQAVRVEGMLQHLAI